MGKVINVQMDEDFYNKIITGDSGDSKPAYIGFEIYQPSHFGEGTWIRYSKDTSIAGDTWRDFLTNDTYPVHGSSFSSDENDNVTYNGNILYNDVEQNGFNMTFSNPVKTTDIVESKLYYLDGGNTQGGGLQ